MPIRGSISHIDLTVSDYERSVPFYDRVLTHLGFRSVKEGSAPAWYVRYASGASWGIALQLAHSDRRSRTPDRYAPGLHHLAFHAESRADVDRTYELLCEIGAQILDPPAEYSGEAYSPGYYAVFFADPDGLKLEVVYEPRTNP